MIWIMTQHGCPQPSLRDVLLLWGANKSLGVVALKRIDDAIGDTTSSMVTLHLLIRWGPRVILVTIWFMSLPMRLLALLATVSNVLTSSRSLQTSPCQTIFAAKAPPNAFTNWVLQDLAHSLLRKPPILLVYIGPT